MEKLCPQLLDGKVEALYTEILLEKGEKMKIKKRMIIFAEEMVYFEKNSFFHL